MWMLLTTLMNQSKRSFIRKLVLKQSFHQKKQLLQPLRLKEKQVGDSYSAHKVHMKHRKRIFHHISQVLTSQLKYSEVPITGPGSMKCFLA